MIQAMTVQQLLFMIRVKNHNVRSDSMRFARNMGHRSGGRCSPTPGSRLSPEDQGRPRQRVTMLCGDRLQPRDRTSCLLLGMLKAGLMLCQCSLLSHLPPW